MNTKQLISDIYEAVKVQGWLERGTDAERDFHNSLSRSFNPLPRVPSLRLSGMGPKCPCSLWHSIHSPELAEPLPAWARIKYDYGHIIEAYVIAAVKASGHEVTGEQDELVVDGVTGHRDCVIDGNLFDIKSTSSRGFPKFRDGTIRTSDDFGYLDQLDGYLLGSRNDPLVRNKQSAYLLAVDKQLGHIAIYEHYLREESIRKRIRDYRAIVALDRPPRCTCEETPDGKSGNIRLGLTASYNAFKYACKPGLRTFLYSDGPRYLTKVVKRPVRQDGTPVPEVDRNGNLVYN